MRIKTTAKEKKVVSAKSWNVNPMGIAISINAPLPPAPQEPIPPQEEDVLVIHIGQLDFQDLKTDGSRLAAWSGFMNRYAMSPVLPLS